MGYTVTSIFSVSANDNHDFFVYYIPSHPPCFSLSTEWIDTWVHTNFLRVARACGPEGVIIAPSQAAGYDDFRRFHDGFGCAFRESGDDEFLHGPFPFLLILRAPIRPRMKELDGLAINLVQAKDQNELEKIFDSIIRAIKTDDWQYLIDSFPLQEPAKDAEHYRGWQDDIDWLKESNRIVELKPNLFGLGINLNRVLEMFGLKARKSQKATRFSYKVSLPNSAEGDT